MKDPDEMAGEFTRLVDDLSYAKTFYPSSRVTAYVNSLAARIYLNIYRNRKEDSNRLVQFWKYDVPLTVGRHHGAILFVFFLFVLFFSVGFFSAANDQLFVREMLGEAYVEKTEQNIRDGNPFGVYASGSSFFMWIWIMINNIMVAFTYFFRGILLGIPSMSALIREAVRIGAFEQLFFARGLGLQSVLTVLIHGLLELTAIIITCAAGLVMGKSVLFPGTHRRLHAFAQGAKDGVKIVIGLVPVFMVAAFFEGFVTRHYKMHYVFSLAILGSAAAFIIWYFILYPLELQRNLKEQQQPVHA
ncbi:stage II sporulation protein M [Paraflavisolibacter sp. H34]|uniref:stage II sporulation protein M n=1 Tax=Huijunlia imazamoxiresistens TaxID=3127457 RepID=UPI0030169A8F